MPLGGRLSGLSPRFHPRTAPPPFLSGAEVTVLEQLLPFAQKGVLHHIIAEVNPNRWSGRGTNVSQVGQGLLSSGFGVIGGHGWCPLCLHGFV